MYSLGVDLGGTSIKAGLVDRNASVVLDGKIPTRKELGHIQVIRDMALLCMELIEKAGIRKNDITSIGVGCPGITDNCSGKLVYATNLGFRNVPVRDGLQEYFSQQVYIENDANCAALAESCAGASRGVDHSVLLTLGTGVGGGIILGRRIFSGFNGAASELGHMVIVNGGIPCSCGRRGCLEQYASATGLVRLTVDAIKMHPGSLMEDMVEGDYSRVSAKTAFLAQRQNDPIGDQVVRKYIDYLSDGIVNMINILYPEMVLVGGGVSKEGDHLIVPLREAVREKAFCHDIPNPSLMRAQMGNEAGIVGAAILENQFR